jgi:hypothetical protein
VLRRRTAENKKGVGALAEGVDEQIPDMLGMPSVMQRDTAKQVAMRRPAGQFVPRAKQRLARAIQTRGGNGRHFTATQ